MTNDLTIEFLRRTDTGLSNKAADLIERLQQERDEARDRLAQAERDADIREDFAHDYGHDEGFRAGIEAASEKAKIFMLGLSKDRSDKMQKAILALTPTDKPSAPSVAESENDGPYTCRSCCAATWNDSDVCDDCALAAREGE